MWKVPLMVLAVFAFTAGIAVGQNSHEIQKDTTSSGGSILNPLPGEAITVRDPMIGLKLPTPTPPLDVNTIKLFLDGNDVTGETQIGLEYIFYTPQMPLSLGVHNVLVSYRQVCEKYTTSADCSAEDKCSWDGSKCSTPNPVLPVSWSFRIVPPGSAVTPTARPAAGKPEVTTTTGRYLFKLKSVNLDNGARLNGNFKDTDIKYKEGIDTSGTFDFASRFYGKTLTGHYDRSIEEITGRANDRFNFLFADEHGEINAGDFYMTARDFSAFTINGVQMRGIQDKYILGENSITSFYGRSQEPQDGRLDRSTYGTKLDYKYSNKNRFRIIGLRTKEMALPPPSTVKPVTDYIYSLQYNLTYSKNLALASETAFNRHSEFGGPAKNNGEDSATKVTVTYKPATPFTVQVGRRSVGPNYNPTVLGSFTENDREGEFYDFKYKNVSNKISISSFYDRYHNNLAGNFSVNNITNWTRNSVSSIRLNYGWILPTVTLSYNKLYEESDRFPQRIPESKRDESTSASLNLIKEFHSTDIFTGTKITGTLSRYDNDKKSHALVSSSETLNRSDTRSWNFSTRFKDKAQFSYSTSLNKRWSYQGNGNPLDDKYTDQKTNTDSLATQLNVIPFKFIVNYAYRRSATKLNTTAVDQFTLITNRSLTTAPREVQQTATFVYYLSQKKKLSLELINFDRQYRKPGDTDRSYDEQSIELGYSAEF